MKEAMRKTKDIFEVKRSSFQPTKGFRTLGGFGTLLWAGSYLL
jgi:hypothetical protein